MLTFNGENPFSHLRLRIEAAAWYRLLNMMALVDLNHTISGGLDAAGQSHKIRGQSTEGKHLLLKIFVQTNRLQRIPLRRLIKCGRSASSCKTSNSCLTCIAIYKGTQKSCCVREMRHITISLLSITIAIVGQAFGIRRHDRILLPTVAQPYDHDPVRPARLSYH